MMNMLPNRKDRRISFSAAKKKLVKGITLVELFITIMIMGIIAGGLVAMMSPFEHGRRLDSSALKLQEDLRQAQAYSMSRRDDHGFYGVHFLAGLGPQNDRRGWQIVCYCQTTAGKCDPSPAPDPVPPFLPIATASFEIIKSSNEADNADLFDNTFFAERVDFAGEFLVGSRIIFTPQGSATSDGQAQLGDTNDDINLTAFGRTVTLRITPLTGHVRKLP